MSGQENIHLSSAGGDSHHKPVAADTTGSNAFYDELVKYIAQNTKEHKAEGSTETAGGGGGSDTKPNGKDPYESSRAAIQSAQELQQLLSKKLPDTATVNDGSGDKTVAQLRSELQQKVRDNFSIGIGQADALKQTGGDDSVEGLLTKFRNDPDGEAKREALAKEFGANPSTITALDIQVAAQKGNFTDAQKKDLQSLYDLQSRYEHLNQLRISSSVVRLQYANVLVSGLLNSDGNGAATGKVPISNAIDAYTLVHQAGNLDKTGDVRNTPQFQYQLTSVDNEYAGAQSVRSQQMLAKANAALAAESKGDTKTAEAAYKDAVKLADGVDLSLLINNLNAQKDQTVQKALLQTINNVETTREDYARFLVQQGRPSEALPLLTKVAGDVPEIASKDKAFNELMNQALTGQKTAGDDPSVHLADLQAAITKKDYATAFDAVKKAQTAMNGTDMELVQKDVEALLKQASELKTQKDALDKATGLDAEQKKTQEAILEQEIAQNKSTLAIEQGKIAMKGHLVYLEGYVDHLRGDNDGAHAKFLEFQKNYPDQAKKPEYDLDDALKSTEHQGWFRRNIDWIAPVTGVAAGLGAAALTIWSGPGAIAAFTTAEIGTTALLAGAGAVGIGMGGTAFVGATALSGEKVTGKTWMEGFGWGALGASAAIAPELTGELGVKLGILSGADAVPTIGGRVLLGGITGAITTVPHAAIQAATNVTYNGQSLGQASLGFGKETLLGVAGGGLAGRVGQSAQSMARWSVGADLIPQATELVTQQYHDISSAIHGDLKPGEDDKKISERNDELPGQYLLPTDAQSHGDEDDHNNKNQ